MSKTREQRKCERAKTAVMVLALLVMWVCLCVVMAKAFLDEAPISGYEYMEQIGGEFDD